MDNARQRGQVRPHRLMRSNSGQAFLIVVLVMVVSMTVGLALISRSVTNLRTSTEEENSQKAFSAAEAGIEKALKENTSVAGNFTGENKASFSTTVTSLSGTDFLINGGNLVNANDGADVWLVPHKADNTPDYSTTWTGSSLTFYWGSNALGDCDNAALEVILIFGNSVSSSSSFRSVFDPCGSRATQNNFSTNINKLGENLLGKTFAYKAEVNSISSGLVVRVVPLYKSSFIGVSGNIALPSQGTVIDSTGTSGTTNRRVSFYQGYPKLPSEFFQYVLFSPT
ncbi:MAG: pilus assembly PilX N-terminal domain-containing protein [Candidatus Levyibacteriota bacterium]